MFQFGDLTRPVRKSRSSLRGKRKRLPVERICAEAKRRGIAVCIDGPHAVAQLPLEIDALECDYYCASCHKWLCAGFGSGFLYVAPHRQASVEPPILSWGRVDPMPVETWSDEFVWTGTRDASSYLTVPVAIEFLRSIGLTTFRDRIHELARYARERLTEVLGCSPFIPDSPEWYGGMTQFPLTSAAPDDLQQQLRQRFGIETPVFTWKGRRWIRVSCHLYNCHADIDLLMKALGELL